MLEERLEDNIVGVYCMGGSRRDVSSVAAQTYQVRVSPRLSLLLAAALGLGLYAPAALADFWYVHYAQAEKALVNEEWSEAIEQLQQALERKGDSGAKVKTYGMNFISYFPHLKLGIAYFELGELDAALQAFETEELLEAIDKSAAGRSELETYRQRAQQGLVDAAAAEAGRIREIVDASLEEARTLERAGSLDAALSALGRGLAVAPEDPRALALVDDLRKKVALREQETRLQERAAKAVSEGQELLVAGRLGEAASAFQRALLLRPSNQVRTLLATTQQRLRDELERSQRAQDAAERAAALRDLLREASSLETTGNTALALDRLQALLALDPSNAEAQALQTRLLAVQADAEQEAAREQQLRGLLASVEEDWNGQRVEASLTAANRVLALDPGNSTALGFVLRAYRKISRDLLGAGRQNSPPAIRFVDLRTEDAEGSQVQLVADPGFLLSGMIVDESAVDVTFRDGDGREIPGASRSQSVGEVVLTEFNLEARLTGGSTMFRLTATDADGLSSASEYTVVYSPPFHRAPWFYLLLATLLALLTTALLWQRHRRRQRLLKRRFNPYVAGAPVLNEDLFYGREALLNRILQTVHNNSLLLHGERRIGKTSLQHHLKRRLQQLDDPDYEFFPVYIDLQGTPEEKFFATLAEDTFLELAPLLGDLETDFSDDRVYTYRDLVRDLRRILAALAQKTTKKVKLVLLIDEVDELNEYNPKINQKLRSLFMKSFAENLVSVVSGVAIKKQWEREGSPWYNFFEEIEVKAFRREDAEKLIEDPIRGLFKFEEGLVDRVITLTDCKPYLIQKLCIALVNRLHEQGRRMITLADVEAIGRPEEA